MNDLAESLVLPELRTVVRKLAPKISIASYYVDRISATEDLKSGGLDLLLDSSEVNAREFEHQPLGGLSYVVAMRQGHELAKKNVTLEQYVAAEHLHVSSRRKGRGQMDVALHAMGYKRDVMMRVQSYLVAARIAEQTNLIWTVPEVLANTTPLYTSKLPFEVEPLTWNLYWHKSASNDPANGWMRDIVAGVVAGIG
jgi:DNA-binding transcriptional LysR family regulator